MCEKQSDICEENDENQAGEISVKIAINATGFHPGKMGGVETYLRNLWIYLQKQPQTDEYTLLCDEWNLREFEADNPLFSIKNCNYSRRTAKRLLRSIIKKTVHYDILQADPASLKADLVHHPFTFISPKWYQKPAVLTFLDMQHEFYPEFFSPEELDFRRKNYPASARTASRVIAISGHAKNCLVERYQIEPDKIDIIHLGYGQQYRVYDNQEITGNVQRKYELHRPFLFYPAATWPHKNHVKLLKSLRLMVDRHNFDGELILTGIAMNGHADIIREIESLDLSRSVRILGYVDLSDLPHIYNLARMLVFPSLFEGFGIPVIEAMACGCPVACSNSTSLPEVIGDAGVMFDPCSLDDMAEKIINLWNDDTRQKELVKAGLARASLFHWEKTARQTLDTYHKSVA